MVMSWILACINYDIIDLVISFTTTAHELWTWIHTLYEPISLPSVNGTIQREVARGSNIEEVSTQVNGERGSKEKDKNQIPKEERTNKPKAKTPKPQPKNHPEKGSPKEEVSKDNQTHKLRYGN